jgi:hypothetical protein
MTMHAATVLCFVKFPRVSNRPQQTVDGRAWQIVKIEAPFCWARPHGSEAPLRRYLVQGEQPAGRDMATRASQAREAVPESEPEAVSPPEAVSAPMPAPRERDDQRLYRNPRGKAAFIDLGRSAIASGVLAPPD